MIGLYRGLTGASEPLIRAWLRHRAEVGREDSARLKERLGIASLPRPPGPLAWVHGASVGETASALGLIERLRESSPETTVLLTSGTVSAGKMLARRMPPGTIHQYVPVDVPRFARRFIDHWRPNLALWIESEIWPNLLEATTASAVPLLLVNGRLSPRSFRRWRRAPRTIARLLRAFDLCIAQSEGDAGRFRALGAERVVCHGNLKHAAPPLACDEEALAALRTATGDRPVWLAASTHPGEEEKVAEAHSRLKPRYPELLTMIVPRHASRGSEVARRLRGLPLVRRSEGRLPDEGTEIYLADTMGELGLFYRAAPLVFIGGSLVPHGGQNPLEPARLGCALLHGPHMHNFAEIGTQMDAARAAVRVSTAEDLAAAMEELLDDPERRRELADNARAYATSGEDMLDAVMAELKPFLSGSRRPERDRARA